jgi:hypothetical protein
MTLTGKPRFIDLRTAADELRLLELALKLER